MIRALHDFGGGRECPQPGSANLLTGPPACEARHTRTVCGSLPVFRYKQACDAGQPRPLALDEQQAGCEQRDDDADRERGGAERRRESGHGLKGSCGRLLRSEERRGGQGWVSTGRYWWAPYT